MNTIRYLLQKEFLQIFRNRAMLPIIFVMPVIQLIVLSFAATFELKEVNMYLVDMDRSPESRELARNFLASGYFTINGSSPDVEEGKLEMQANRVSMILNIPHDFGKDLQQGISASPQVIINAVDGSTAGLIQGYSRSIIQDFTEDVRPRNVELKESGSRQQIDIIPASWYNPNLDYLQYMVPGILVVLVSMIGMFLSGMNIVREREIGTIEQLNVTPVRRYQFITAKLLPFWILALFELGVGLLIVRFGFGIPFEGSVLLLFGVAGIYMLVVQGAGLFISTITHTQQQAMFIAWFFMVVFILMGGLFTPIESMPEWAQRLSWFNPVAHFIEIMRRVMLKGAGWADIQSLIGVLTFMAAVVLPAAVLRYRKTAA